MINAIKRVEYTISTKKVTNPAAKVRLLLITDLHSSFVRKAKESFGTDL